MYDQIQCYLEILSFFSNSQNFNNSTLKKPSTVAVYSKISSLNLFWPQIHVLVKVVLFGILTQNTRRAFMYI